MVSSSDSFPPDAFDTFDITLSSPGQLTIHGVKAKPQDNGKPPLLLLHGHPQTHHIWHKVAPLLKQHYTVIATDLRGHGESSKPSGDQAHETYSKRAMARDQVEVMKSLGYDKFYVVGHDRGGRVAHRMALDYPDTILKLIVLDIAPTLAMYEQTGYQFATFYWHWFFLIQPSPVPETLLANSPDVYLTRGGMPQSPNEIYSAGSLDATRKNLTDPAAIHAMCEDYRASAPGSYDLSLDEADRRDGKKIKCETRVLWGKKGVIEKLFNAKKEWGLVCEKPVNGRAVDTGHYIPEEMPPKDLADDIISFLGHGV